MAMAPSPSTCRAATTRSGDGTWTDRSATPSKWTCPQAGRRRSASIRPRDRSAHRPEPLTAPAPRRHRPYNSGVEQQKGLDFGPGAEKPKPQRRTWMVSQLTDRLQGVLETEFFDVWVEGEVSN